MKLDPFKGIEARQGFILHPHFRFDPGTLAIIGLSTMAVGTGVSAYGQYQAGSAEQSAANYNARVLERQAQTREQKSLFEQQRQAEAASRQSSTMRAGFGSAGVISSEGTPLLIQAEQAHQSELENLMIGYQGMNEGQYLRSQAQQQRYAGKIAKQAGTISAGATLLQGFGSTALTAGMMGQMGMFSGGSPSLASASGPHIA